MCSLYPRFKMLDSDYRWPCVVTQSSPVCLLVLLLLLYLLCTSCTVPYLTLPFAQPTFIIWPASQQRWFMGNSAAVTLCSSYGVLFTTVTGCCNGQAHHCAAPVVVMRKRESMVLVLCPKTRKAHKSLAIHRQTSDARQWMMWEQCVRKKRVPCGDNIHLFA